MKAIRTSLAAMVAAATLLGGGALATTSTAYAADGNATITVTPNPWNANTFEGWGTSLAWFANATGSLGEESSITDNLGDEASKAKAVEYGKQLREQFYKSVFGEDGLDLNMARYNVGGGNASDVAYGYPFMRQGAAVPGTWKDDADGSAKTYGDGVTTKQADKDKLAAAFDPTDSSQYDFSKSSAQDWWITRGATGDNPDITDIEAFSNSAPWFLTESGYATGGYNSGKNNLKDPEKFAQYLAKNVEHLESLGANVDTVEPFNESETSYWGTPGDTAADGLSDSWSGANGQLVKRYWNKYYKDKNAEATPYSTGLKKPQEGMHVDNAQQQQTLNALAKALNGNDDTIIAATDATNANDFIRSYNAYPQEVRDLVDQYNVHAYSDDGQMQARDVAQADGKKLSMSEVDGSWQGGSYNPYGFDNALGMMSKISSNVTRLQSKDFTFWQVVEDLYNMQMGSNVNPAGENTNWGTVLIDFDCTVAGADGKLYSERRVNNNGGKTDGIAPCTVIANAKYNGVKAITHFIHPGDKVIANNDEKNTMTATAADGTTQTIVHRNSGTAAQTFVIDLSKYETIADDASGDLYLTTETAQSDKDKGVDAATPEVFAKTSNVKQADGSVVIDKAAKTATVTVPARSIASIQLKGVSGVAKDARVQSGHAYQLVGKQSGKALANVAAGDSALSLADAATTADAAKQQTFTFTPIEQAADSERPDLKAFVITNADGKVLVAKNGTNAFSDSLTVEQAKSDKTAEWILNTSDGSTYQLLNAAAKQNLDVDGSKTAVGTKVGLWQSPSGTSPAANQTWTLRDVVPTGAKPVNVQTAVNAAAQLPETVTLYYASGEGPATVSDWDVSKVDTAKAGTYEATGTAKDIYGNEFKVTAKVYVGAFTVSDPVSATVLVGSDEAAAKAALEAAPVNLHVKASPAFAADAAKVTWNWDGVADKLANAKAGDAVTVTGAYKDGDTTIALNGTIYLTAAEPENVADANSNLTVTGQQTEYNKGDQWKKLTDGDTAGEGWITWNSKGDYSVSPTATIDFGSEHEVSSLTITYGDKAPASAKAEYTTDGTTWKQFGDEAKPAAGETVTFKTDGTVKATQVRIVNTVNNDYMNATEIQAFVVPTVGGEPQPASDATLGDLRLDGKTIEGFASDKNGYTVNLPYDAQANPVLQAFATDNAATVKVTGDAVEAGKLGGTAVIDVTAADGTTPKQYTVTFNVDELTGLSVTGPTKTEYEIGEALDLTGLKVYAVYENGETVELQQSEDANNGYVVSGFDSTTSGAKTVTVTYRGASAKFNVTVKAASVAPGPEPQPAPNGKPGTKPAGGLSATGASVSGVVGVIALLVAAAGVVFITRKRRA